MEAIDLAVLSPCFDRQSLADEVARWLERGTVDGRVHVTIRQIDGDLGFVIRFGDQEPLVRRFPELPRDCPGELRAVALSIALAVDAITPKGAGFEPARRFRLSAQSVLTTPAPEHPGIGGAVGLRIHVADWFSPQIGVLAAVAPSQSVSADSAARFDAWWTLVQAAGCAETGASRVVRLGACLGVLGGAATVVARGIPDDRTESAVYGAVAGSATLLVRLADTVGLDVAADALLPFRPGRVRVLDASGRVAASRDLPRFAGMLRIGPAFLF